MSSLNFLGNATSYLRIPNTDAFDFGTGDFTIEWYQFQTDSNPFPRIFQVGNYPNTSIGVSIEGGTFYYWRNGSPTIVKSLNPAEYKNQWVHFAISRSSGVTKVFMNGVIMTSPITDTTDFNGVNDLIISNESTLSNSAAFGGYITYFSWVKGVSLYNADFTVPTNYPTLTANYVLLLSANGFDGTLGATVVNNNVSNVPNVPEGVLSEPTNSGGNGSSANLLNMWNIRPLFTDNSRVYYERGSLAACGVGSVRNSSIKSKKI